MAFANAVMTFQAIDLSRSGSPNKAEMTHQIV